MMSVITKNIKGKKIAEESQLLAEERILIDAIKNIRTQRNCLQIERLQLESMLGQQKHGPLEKTLETKLIVENNTKDPNATIAIPENIEFVVFDTDNPGITIINEDLCNIEELNLTVSEPIFANASTSRYTEEEEDDEYSTCDENMILDMDMFMTN